MTFIEVAIFWLGILSGYGFGLTKRRKPTVQVKVDVDEDVAIVQFEKHMAAAATMQREIRQPTDRLH